MIDMYCTSFSLGKILLSVGPLCTGLINAWLSHAGSRHNLTLPLALEANTKLLHNSDVSSTPSGVTMSISYRHFSSSLNGFCSTEATCLGGAWYGLLSGLSCNENVPSKHPIPLQILPNLVCILCVMVLLLLCLHLHYLMYRSNLLTCLDCLGCFNC